MSVETAGYAYWQNKPRFQLSADVGSQYVMYIIEKGACWYHFNNHEGVAKANDVLVVPPYTNFQRKMLLTMTFHFVRLTSDTDIPHSMIGNHHYSTSRFTENCSMLKKTNFSFHPRAQIVRNHIVNDFMITKIMTYFQPAPKNIRHRNQTITAAINLMHQDLTLSISKIASQVGLNAAYFSKTFKKVTGESPISFYTKIKLKKVQSLLITTDLSLTEIADTTGFNDSFYLSRVFSRYLNCSPSEFRKNHII